MASSSPSRFGDLLRQYRLVAGLTQQALAERAGLSVYGVQKLERGVTHPYRDTAQRLVLALSLAPEDEARLRAAGQAVRRGPTMHKRRAIRAEQQTLPLPISSFVGREREQAEVARLLTTSRLVTLTGTGGVGKTRLAIEVARQAATAFRDGVSFASLAALSDARFVSSTVAHALGVREHAGRALQQQLCEFLRDRHRLLVLDNCEHVLAAMPDLAALLTDCRQLTILATSRTSLRITGEHEFRVPPLETPRPEAHPRQHTDALQEDRSYDAVLLFLARARTAGAPFTRAQLSGEDAATVGAICVQLDGLPLALELAAARTSYLPPSTLLRRLGRQLDVLTRGPRDAPARQQTVRATLDWSYGLLTVGEQRLFGRLAVFAGGLTLNAVEAVYASLGAAPETVLDDLTALADHGLVHAVGMTLGRARFAMLAAVREYALERLADEAHLVRRAHAEHFATLAEEAEPRLLDRDADVWYERLDAEFENIQAVLSWCCGPAGLNAENAETGLRLAGALWLYSGIRGRQTGSRTWLDGILAAAGRFEHLRWSQAFARTLAASGILECHFGDLPRARLHGQRALAVARRLHLRREAAMAALVLSDTALGRGTADEARHWAEKALASLGRELRAAPDRWFAAYAEMELGEAARLSGDKVAATDHLSRSARHYQQLGDALAAAKPQLTLVQLALRDGDALLAAERLDEVCTTVTRAPATWATAQWPLATFVSACAGLAMLRDQVDWAVRMLGASSELRPGTPMELEPADWECYAAAARERMGAAAFATAWAYGQSVARTGRPADITRLAELVRNGLAESALPGNNLRPSSVR